MTPWIITTDIHEKEGIIHMYAGDCRLPFATLLRSHGGKAWQVLLKIPMIGKIRPYDALDKQMVAATAALQMFVEQGSALPEDLKS